MTTSLSLPSSHWSHTNESLQCNLLHVECSVTIASTDLMLPVCKPVPSQMPPCQGSRHFCPVSLATISQVHAIRHVMHTYHGSSYGTCKLVKTSSTNMFFSNNCKLQEPKFYWTSFEACSGAKIICPQPLRVVTWTATQSFQYKWRS